jgi:hypothetical protein
MRGNRGDVDIFGQPNELAAIVDYKSVPVWKALMKRCWQFQAMSNCSMPPIPDVPTEELGFQHAANAHWPRMRSRSSPSKTAPLTVTFRATNRYVR